MITLPNVNPDMIANNLTPFEPTHPGEILGEEIEYRGVAPSMLANQIGVNTALLEELINGKRDFTIEYAMMVEAALGIDADFWMNLQLNYNKAKIKHDVSFMSKLANIRSIASML